MKKCSKCGQEKSLHEFYAGKSYYSGFSCWCKDCERQRWRNQPLEYRKKRLTQYRKNMLRRQYGLSQEDYNKLLMRQNGVCAICSKPETKWIRGALSHLCVDHNHITGKVRGLLCYACNLLIGRANEDVHILDNAKEYLLRSK